MANKWGAPQVNTEVEFPQSLSKSLVRHTDYAVRHTDYGTRAPSRSLVRHTDTLIFTLKGEHFKTVPR